MSRISRRQNEQRGGTSRNSYLLYTFLFIAFAFLVYLPFIIEGKSFVFKDANGGGDGIVQHYNSFVYYGKYLRGIIKGLITNHSLTIPMFDLSIGYGQDIIQTLSYYVIGDPFSFASVFFPVKYSEIGYSLMIVLRQYLAGVSFLIYYWYIKNGKSRDASFNSQEEPQDNILYPVIGALIYVFSSYVLYLGILHPYFTNPMVYMPIILVGAEKVLKKENPTIFVLAIAIAAISNFYFFYMIFIFTVLYVLFRFLMELDRGDSFLRQLISTIGRFLLYGIWGGLIAAVLLGPSVIGILTSSRAAQDTSIPLLYNLQYYGSNLGYFISGGIFMGYTVIALISVIILVLRFRETKEGKYTFAWLLLMILFATVPYFGHMFNGFSYVVNRWMWGLGLFIAYVVSVYLPKIRELKKYEWLIIIIVTGIFTFVPHIVNPGFNSIALKTGMILAFLAAAIMGIYFALIHPKSPGKVLILILLGISLFQNSFFRFMPIGNNALNLYMKRGGSYAALTSKAPGHILNDIEDDSFYRYDGVRFNQDNVMRNSAMQLKKYSTSYYFSTANPEINRFFRSLYLNTPTEQSYINLDSRAPLEAIMGVKYYVVNTDNPKYLPNYSGDLLSEREKFKLYENELFLPLGFTSERVIPYSLFQSLSVTERQQALLQGIVIEDDDASGNKVLGLEHMMITMENLEFSDEELNWEVKSSDGVEVKATEFEVTKEDASMEISFPERADGDLYLVFDGLDYEPPESYNGQRNSALIRIRGDQERNTWISIRNSRDNYYSGRHDFLSNVYYSKNPRNSIILEFPYMGRYTFDDARVFFQPTDRFQEMQEVLGEVTLEDPEIGVNEIRGTIDAPSERVMCISIPAINGWKAYVDGEECEILKGNVGFIALHIQPGSHEIQLRYRTPYLRICGIVSIVSTIGFAVYIIFVKRRNRW